jgi:hypothetical protein
MKDFKSIQMEGNLWQDGTVLIGRHGKKDITNLFVIIILFDAFF